jgi:hypothetical protein
MNDDYPLYHQHPTNILIHIFAVPVFVCASIGSLSALFTAEFLSFAGYACLLLGSLAAQGYGHKLEQNKVKMFDSPLDFAKRVLLEQFYKFWRYIISSGENISSST